MSKDVPRLSRLGVLAPAALSACMDASVLAVPAAGAIVSTVLKELSKAFMLKKWFHGSMSAKEAESLMMERGKNGSYLVRESKAHPGDYVLTVRVRGRVSHVMIKKQNNKYEVGSGEQFEDLVALIEHFRTYPMVENSGDVLRLLQPISGTSVPVTDIENKLIELHEIEESKADGRRGLSSEFHSLQTLDNLNDFTTNEGEKNENASKNRYRNVLPYDQTRVILNKIGENNTNDYINASFIHGNRDWDSSSSVQSSNESLNSVKSLSLKNGIRKVIPLVSKSLSDEAIKEVKRTMKLDKLNGNFDKTSDKIYIATQGCMSNTVDDFWKMVWQEDIRIIVMITNELEKGKKKCERYWPENNQEMSFETVTVKTVSETHFNDYLMRELRVNDKDTNTSRKLFQYQFISWPDHGTPSSPESILAFTEDINRRLVQIQKTKSRPSRNVICVHCSAGVGRTGTFISIDIIIDKIKESGYDCDIDVHETVKLVRAQRKGMVQNKSQYKFIYQVIQEYVNSKKQPPKKKRIYYSFEA